MKITVNVDCTPDEARAFLGLLDIKPLREAFMVKMMKKMSSDLSSEDMEKMFSLWVTPGVKTPDFNLMGKNMEAFQNMFWAAAKSGDK
ncbi:MAG: hypothetical protein COB54_05040 [Alphaproteobacteria bacterium]|nr:MAG: hypothetical protein COB54_05040 [Alphaproteobacteria bacterium]